MAHWVTAKDGNFNTKKDWSPKRVPVYNAHHKDDAILDVVGGAYTVTTTTNEDVKSIQTASNATLSLTGVTTFVVQDGTGTFEDAGANAGSILVGDGATLQLNGGPFKNTGHVDLNAAAGNAFIDVELGVVLSGGGTIVMGDSAFNGIVDLGILGTSSDELNNIDNTISGSGVIGSGGLPGGAMMSVFNEAAGVIDATGALNPLILNTPGVQLNNDGLLEATGAAGLDISSTTVAGSGGGVIRAGTGSTVRLLDAVIAGGTLKTVGSGEVVVAAQSTFDGTSATVHNQGGVQILDGAGLVAAGTLDNSGSVALEGLATGSTVTLSGNLTLQGGGSLFLSDFAGNVISANTFSDTLTNVDNTIFGDGQIGQGQMTLVNQSAGSITETGASGLIIDTGSATITNAGLIEAVGTGGVTIESVANNSGVLEVNGAHASGPCTMMINAAVKNTGTLLVDGGSLMAFEPVTGGGSATIKGGGLLYFGSSFNENVTFASQAGILELTQSQSYTKSVTGIATRGQGDILDLNDIGFVGSGEATFVDNGKHTGGVLTVSDGVHTAHINLVGDYHASTFGAFSDQNGGVDVFCEATTEAQAPAASHRFVAAMAGMGAGVGGPAHVANEGNYARPVMLSVPRMAMA